MIFKQSEVEKQGDNFRKVRNIMLLLPLMLPEYKKLLRYRIINRLTQEETAKLMGKGKSVIERMEKRLRETGIEIPKAPAKSSKYIQRDLISMIEYSEV